MKGISIIICSRTKKLTPVFLENIEKTVGVDYELIVIDNSENKYSIFEAYNLGIKKSKGEVLCFMHDDVLFHTNNWGNILQTIFNKNELIGLIGILNPDFKRTSTILLFCDITLQINNLTALEPISTAAYFFIFIMEKACL